MAKEGFTLTFNIMMLLLVLVPKCFDHGLLARNLYILRLDNKFIESLISFNVDENLSKRKREEKTSSMLWHQRLGHISRDQMLRLVNDEVLANLNFSDFNKCVEVLERENDRGE